MSQLEQLLNGGDTELLTAVWQEFVEGQHIDAFTFNQKAVVGALASRLGWLSKDEAKEIATTLQARKQK